MNLLENVSKIRNRYKEELHKTGEDFNIFSIIGMQSNERYAHSAFIAELLNPRGSHTFGDSFLKSFLKHIDKKDFESSHCEVIVEEYFPNVPLLKNENETLNTFLDIVVKNHKTKKAMLIENKIYAIDQPEQLERYERAYKDRQKDFKAEIFYLTLDGKKYWNNDFTNYKTISYEKHIKNWLLECIYISKSKQFVSQSIEIYYNLIENLTNNSKHNQMNTEIQNQIISSKENFESAQEIYNNFIGTKKTIIDKFWALLNEKFPDEKINYNDSILDYAIYGDYDDYLFLGFKYNGVDEDNKLKKIINKITENTNYNVGSNENWFYWINTKNDIISKNHLDYFSASELFDLNIKMDQIVNEIVSEFQAIVDKIKQNLN